MKNLKIIFLALLILWFGISGASADSILYDWAFNVDGTTYEAFFGDSMPTTGSLNSQGLGTLTWTTTLAGSHNFIAFFDHEADQSTNTYFNEIGATSGTPNAGQSWEIDEPGWVDGDIYENLFTSTLDNGIGTSVYGDTTFPDDVSMAIGWDFLLGTGETATISLLLADTSPGSGFWLAQTDDVTGETIYFSSTLEITGGGPDPIPEPTTLLLVGAGLIGLAGLGRRKFRKQS